MKSRLAWLAGVGGIGLAITLFLSLTADPPAPETALPSAYSRSALGYHALAETLRDHGQSALVSRWRSGDRGSPTVPVLVLEPVDEHLTEVTNVLVGAARRGATTVLGLPKWTGGGDERGWVAEVSLRSADEVLATLAIVDGPGAELVEPEALTGWTSTLGTPPPTLPHRPQLLAPGAVDPLVWCDQGVLIGTIDNPWGGSIVVIADPDLWNTHGLGRGDNALVVEALIERQLGASGVVFDETIHGFERAPSLWKELTTFPLSLFTASLIALFGLSVVAAAVRFGPPRELPPRLAPGTAGLVASTVGLLEGTTRRRYALRQYFAATVRRLAEHLGVPPGLTDEEQLAALERHCTIRGTPVRPSELAEELATLPAHPGQLRALRLASRIHDLRQEIVHADR